MLYTADVTVHLTLSNHVTRVEIQPQVEASLDCHVCRRSRRTAFLFAESSKSFCTTTYYEHHPKKARIADLSIDQHWEGGRPIVAGRYLLEFDYEAFRDRKNFLSRSSPDPAWARASFTLTCTCGADSEFSTQTNQGRLRVNKCRCGNVLHYETAENPVLGRAKRSQAGEATLRGKRGEESGTGPGRGKRDRSDIETGRPRRRPSDLHPGEAF
jgi:hypothetical protein